MILVEHPQLDFADEVIRVCGWPALATAFIWVVRKWDKGQRDIKTIIENSQLAVVKVEAVDTKVDLIKDNHLAHLQDGIASVAATNQEAVKLLTNMDKGITVLVDRGNRI